MWTPRPRGEVTLFRLRRIRRTLLATRCRAPHRHRNDGGLLFAPTRLRKYIVGALTFVAGLIYVASISGRSHSAIAEGEGSANFTESGAISCEMVNLVGDFSNIRPAPLGLGISRS